MKITEVREMSVADLRDRIAVEKANLSTMKMNHAISPLEDTSKIKKARKDIARISLVFTATTMDLSILLLTTTPILSLRRFLSMRIQI